MPFVRIWVHIVWSTKNREPQLTDQIRSQVMEHIRENAAEKAIYLAEVNGYRDHVHCLLSLKSSQSLAKVVQLIKGESAHWINQNSLLGSEIFQWQTEYYAVSVGKSEIARIRAYIQDQEIRHRKQELDAELELLVEEDALED